jgi:hypothetical protein
MFVTLKVFKLIGPSNDGRRHGRGTYLFVMLNKMVPLSFSPRDDDDSDRPLIVDLLHAAESEGKVFLILEYLSGDTKKTACFYV